MSPPSKIKMTDINKKTALLQSKGEILQAQENNLMTLEQVAEILHYDLDYVRKKCKELGFTKNGVKTFLNEAQVEELRKILVPRTLDMKVQGDNIKTSISIKENFLKATQDYIALIENEKKQLEQELKEKENQNQLLIENQKNIVLSKKDKIQTQELWNQIIKYIRKKGEITFDNDYREATIYFYNKFRKLHCIDKNTKINKQFFFKYKEYMKELLDIIIGDFEL